jgi:hypothetical protein
MKKYYIIISLFVSTLSFGQQRFEQGFFETDGNFTKRIINDIDLEIKNLNDCKFRPNVMALYAADKLIIDADIVFNDITIDGDISNNVYSWPKLETKVYTKKSKVIVYSSEQNMGPLFLFDRPDITRIQPSIRIDLDIENLYSNLSSFDYSDDLLVEFIYKSKSIGLYQYKSIKELVINFNNRNFKVSFLKINN